MQFRVLGPLHVEGSRGQVELGGPKQRLVLALLLSDADRVVSTDRLIDDVWGESPPDAARNSLQSYVSNLRKALGGSESIEGRDGGYALVVADDDLDAAVFAGLVERARGDLERDPAAAAAFLREALALWRGDPFEDMSYEPALQSEIRRLTEARLAALEQRIDADIAAGGYGELIAELEALTTEHPMRERFWGQLMEALYLSGRQAEALRTYQRARASLAEELGIEPGPELQQLEDRILRQDPTLLSAQVTRPNPYKGLRPFTEDDSSDFFGRRDLTNRLLGRLAERGVRGGFAVLTGPSGSGKSSVVHAGLIPALRSGSLPGSEDWEIVTTYPGSDPYQQLAEAAERTGFGESESLARGVVSRFVDASGPLLLFVDQFEETWTLVEDAALRREYLQDLIALSGDGNNARVLLAIRADFLERLVGDPLIAPLLEEVLVVVPPLTELELEEAIARPAAAAGVTIEPDLVAQIVRDAHGRLGALPLLQYALNELFEHRRDDSISRAEYDVMGGIAGALSRRADDVYLELPDRVQATARSVFLRLVAITDEANVAKRRVTRGELDELSDEVKAVDRVVDEFGRHRFLVFDRDPEGRPTVEISHESLLYEWSRLRGWIDERTDDLRVHAGLRSSVREWEESGREQGYLLEGRRLAEVDQWAETTDLSLTAGETEFVRASRDARDANRRRTARRRRTVIAVLAVAALVAGTLAVVALGQRNEAEEARDAAKAQAELARSRELAASAINHLDDDPELSVLLALQAADITEPPLESLSALREALVNHAGVYTYTWPADRSVDFVTGVLSPDGRLLAVSNWLDRIEVWDWEQNEMLWDIDLVPVPDGGSEVGAAWFMANGEKLVYSVTGAASEVEGNVTPVGVHVLDAQTGEQIDIFDFGPCGGEFNTQWIASGTGADAVVLGSAVLPGDAGCDPNVDPAAPAELWALDIETGEYTVITSRPDSLYFAALSGDARFVAWTPSEAENVTHVVELDGNTEIATLNGVTVEALSPDGSLLTGFPDDPVWDVSSGELIARFHGHDTQSWVSWFSRSGETAYSSGFGGNARLWDPLTGEELAVLRPGSPAYWVSLSGDESVVAVSSTENTIQIFSLGGGGALGEPIGSGDFRTALGGVAVAGERGAVQSCPRNPVGNTACRLALHDLSSGKRLWFRDDVWGSFAPMGISPDGGLVAAQELVDGDTSGSVILVDGATGVTAKTLEGWCGLNVETLEPAPDCVEPPDTPYPESVRGMAFSPDGFLIAVRGTFWGTLSVWDVRTGEMTLVDQFPEGFSQGIAFSPAGDVLAVGLTGAVRTYETTTWSVVAERTDESFGPLGGGAAFTPDGRHIVGIPNQGFGAPAISVLNAETLEDVIEPITDVHDGTIWDMALSPDGSLVATAGADGFVRVWDWANRELVDEIPLGSSAASVDFVDDRLLLVAPESGPPLIVTTDHVELLERARSKLTRTFTAGECVEFSIDPCLTLEQIKAG